MRLAGGGHHHGPRPVVIEVGQLVRQLLEVIGLQAGGVLDDVVAGGVDGALPHGLGDKEEVISLREGDNIIHDGATGRVGGLATHLEEPCVDPLADYDVGEEKLIISEAGSSEAVLDGGDLMLHHVWDLSITNTVPKLTN